MALKWISGLVRQEPVAKAVVRRRSRRISRYFDCTWMSQWGAQRARVSSLSGAGCFIDSRTAPPVGADVSEITITLPAGTITVHGTVVDATPGIGFGVRFADLSSDAKAHVNDLLLADACRYPAGRADLPRAL